MPIAKEDQKEFTIDGYSKYVKSIDDFTALKVASKMIDGISANMKTLTQYIIDIDIDNLKMVLSNPSKIKEMECEIRLMKDGAYVCTKFFDKISIDYTDIIPSMSIFSETKDRILSYCISRHEEHFKQKEIISIGLSKYEKAGLFPWKESNK
jgi:hypothetical protein